MVIRLGSKRIFAEFLEHIKKKDKVAIGEGVGKGSIPIKIRYTEGGRHGDSIWQLKIQLFQNCEFV